MLNLPHCLFDKDDSLNYYQEIRQIIAYDDDSIEISYKDDSNLQLSPCGSNFKYTRAQKGTQPFLARHLNEVTQRCVFATSETKRKVVHALIIRNQICKRPYILSEFLPEMAVEPFRLYKELHEIEWEDSSKSVFIKHTPDGKVMVHSADNFAQLELFPDGVRVRVHFAAALSDKGVNFCKDSSKDDSSQGDCSARHMYIWQSQIFPAAGCPRGWKYPLKLAILRKYGDQIPSELNLDCTERCTSLAPRSLPKKCPRQFSHRWRIVEPQLCRKDDPHLHNEPQFAGSSIRFLWCEQGSFWLSTTDASSKIEVWLSNGAVFKSHPTTDRYFVHSYPSTQNEAGKVELTESGKYTERIMSAASMPHNQTLKSVALRAIRLITYKSQHNNSMKSSIPCWHSSEPVSAEADSEDNTRLARAHDLQENVHISGVGTFSVAADSAQIQFCDGVMLHMTLFSDAKMSQTDCCNFSCGQCRTVLADGRYFVTDDINQPDPKVEKYVGHARSWAEWLSKPNDERRRDSFYIDTIYDKAKTDLVSRELHKIQKLTGSDRRDVSGAAKDFQYMEFAGNIDTKLGQRRCTTYQDVSKALSHTSKAIDDIDAMLSFFK